MTATGNPYAAFVVNSWISKNWGDQGADAGLYQNDDIHAIRILAMEPASSVVGRSLLQPGQRAAAHPGRDSGA